MTTPSPGTGAPLRVTPAGDMPFDQYQRYRITGDLIAAAASERTLGRVLDVGGHHEDFWGRPHRPIAETLPDVFSLTLDVAANPLHGYVRGRGDALPFRDAAFDVVVSVDVLEHVPAGRRPELLAELKRVASRAVILAAPFADPRVQRAEALLASFVAEACGYEQGQLAEHARYGLPGLDETLMGLGDGGWKVRVFPYGNLWRWLFMMIDKHAAAALPGSRDAHTALDAAFNTTWFERDTEPPCYRHFLVAARGEDEPMLAAAERRFRALPSPSPVPASPADDQMLRLAEMHARSQAILAASEPGRRTAHIAEVEAHRDEMYRHLAARDEYIAKLKAQFRAVEQSWSFRLGRLVRTLLPGRGSPSS